MATDFDGISKVLHELAPWAGVAIAAIGVWKANRANENSKKAVKKVEEHKEQSAEQIGEVQDKLEEVHKTINGRVEEIRASAKKEGILEERLRQSSSP